MKKSVKGIALATALLMCSSFGVSVSAADEVAINATNFPDEVFREYVSEKYDVDGSNSLSADEINKIKYVFLDGYGIASFKGIEYFTSMATLDCSSNKLTSLDVSKNTALADLECSSNNLTSLDVSKNTALTELTCDSNGFTSLDVSQNTALEYLDCRSNNLTNLDVSKNAALKTLYCYNNQLTSLDVSKNTAMEYLDCGNNQLTNLDVSKNTELIGLGCNYTQLTNIDVSKNTKLIGLGCSYNQLTNLDLSENTALEELSCMNNQLTKLDLSNNTALTKISCPYNQLTSIDVSNCAKLTYLWCANNNLTSVDVSGNPALYEFHCGNNHLTSLDVSKNTELVWLSSSFNEFHIGDISDSYDLSNLPKGFDVSRTFYWEGAEVSGNKLVNITGIDGENKITYLYGCGRLPAIECTLTYNIVEITDPVESFVNRLYTILLGRNAEPAGLADWTSKLKTGTATSAEIVSGIAGSQEFANFGLSNEEIVERMYQAMLGRPSDAAGKASWVNGLNSGMTVNGIVNGFSGSQEFGQICAEYGIQAGSVSNLEARDKSAGLTSFIARMYTKALGRSYDVAGLNDWTNRYLTGEAKVRDIAFGFIFSPEFVNKNLSDSDYVDTLYRTFFNREPDEGGKANWMAQLAGGTPREAVLNGFVGSQECANLVASFGI